MVPASLPLAGQTVLVTRAREQSAALTGRLREAGANVVHVPAIEIVPTDHAPLDAAIRALASYAWIVFTSSNTVTIFVNRLEAIGREPDLGSTRVAAVGSATAAALRSAGLSPDEVGHVHAHGLATHKCDEEEAAAINAVFAGRKAPAPVVAAKSYFGNLGAGSGLVELIASTLALGHGNLFATLNYETPDPRCDIAVVTSGDREFSVTWHSPQPWEVTVEAARVSPSYSIALASERLVWRRTAALASLTVRLQPVIRR